MPRKGYKSQLGRSESPENQKGVIGVIYNGIDPLN
jgi:hypothetical protein